MATTKVPVQFLILLALLNSAASHFPHNNNSTQSSFDLDTYHNQLSNETFKCLPGSSACQPNVEEELEEKWFSASLDTYLTRSSVIYGLIRQSSPSIVSQQCHLQLQSIAKGIHSRDVWAMKSEFASYTKTLLALDYLNKKKNVK